ncbi:cbb3-type cytochrome oxidase assembly protein CcoS [Geoalkalibacter halelectricus]|uniref:Cbb3-type cytochrome oxidase assembly protein CcoS n=1 Tax=Geoalkalibacter halelectricus TaxID=2847045 RepID=A0ABY5ZSU4_9BACT|nr:cbb3-type cytochrome oxidase assembly protein CcoS [Geoalkalibacter halelectricus]MDO3377506.1 cbb3-type cytochrome oxidase assembly protein CcoS [Geoalkalibacter halelectricus]UWZ80734.1 cbb3-type cytochrome oxidase assembly protein CcoS [Geoalkalibacter halelectricus]
MLQSTLILIILSLFVGAGVWLVFVWAVKKGEFDDIEGPKHRMLDDEQGSHAQRRPRRKP